MRSAARFRYRPLRIAGRHRLLREHDETMPRTRGLFRFLGKFAHLHRKRYGPIVLGRKNWLFAGSEAAAHRTAIVCSLVQTCKRLQINLFVYLRDVIERVSTHPARLVLELTPREWKCLRLDSGAQTAA